MSIQHCLHALCSRTSGMQDKYFQSEGYRHIPDCFLVDQRTKIKYNFYLIFPEISLVEIFYSCVFRVVIGDFNYNHAMKLEGKASDRIQCVVRHIQRQYF